MEGEAATSLCVVATWSSSTLDEPEVNCGFEDRTGAICLACSRDASHRRDFFHEDRLCMNYCTPRYGSRAHSRLLTVPFGARRVEIGRISGGIYGEVGVRWYVSWNEQGRLLRLHSQRWKICDNLQKRQMRQGSHVVIENSENRCRRRHLSSRTTPAELSVLRCDNPHLHAATRRSLTGPTPTSRIALGRIRRENSLLLSCCALRTFIS